MSAHEINTSAITLAVLPFENLTVGREHEIYCKSFCIDLITELSKFRQFQIIAYPTALNYQMNLDKGVDVSILHVDYFIQGSFRSRSNHIRVNVQLSEGRTHRLIWAHRLEDHSADVQDLQEELYMALVSTLQKQLNYDLLSQINRKQKVELKAYEYWLRGIEEIKKGAIESDMNARSYFQQAIDLEPGYSLAHSGMSLSFFNEWSCQLWERWEISQSGAFEWAQKAMELDDQNYVAAYILGRLYLYDEAFESAEYYLRKSLSLNSNDPESLIVIASCFIYLEYKEEAFELYKKALRLNPANAEMYHPTGGFILFEMGQYPEAVTKANQAHSNSTVDAPAIFAAAYFHLMDYEKMEHYWQLYLKSFQAKIKKGNDFNVQEAIEWMKNVNPFKGKSNLQPFWDYICQGIVPDSRKTIVNTWKNTRLSNQFLKEGELWRVAFEGISVQMAELKGFFDIQKLLVNPGAKFHCAELIGSILTSEGEVLLDEKAKKAYQKEILEIQQEIIEAESNNDFSKLGPLHEKYDHLIDHLSQSLGLKGKVRHAGNPIEKARSAITWRIRNAIAKIEKTHPALGKHLSNTIKTGTFCTYQPEKDLVWIIE